MLNLITIITIICTGSITLFLYQKRKVKKDTIKQWLDQHIQRVKKLENQHRKT